MIISNKYKYIFIGLPFSGSSVISKELLELYGGVSIYGKHSNIQSILNNKDINIKDYFVFAVYRDPVEICNTTYTKYVNNTKGVFTNNIFLIENGGHISRKDVELHNVIQSQNIDFNGFLKLKHKNFIPYDSVFSINEKYLNYQINFSTLNADFREVLLKLGIEPIRDLPIYNKTANKLKINNNFDENIFMPYYRRNDSLFKDLAAFNLKSIWFRGLYLIIHPIRKYKWLKADRNRSDLRDEYFSKL